MKIKTAGSEFLTISRFTRLFFLAAILAMPAFYAQDKPVAVFSGGKIMESELKDRLELAPMVRDHSFKKDSARFQLLYSMIAEKLWAKEAEAGGFDQNPELQGYLSVMKKMLVRDELFKEEVEKNVVITDRDYEEAKERNKTALSILILSDNDSAAIFQKYSQIGGNSKVFDSLFLTQKDTSALTGYDVHYGDIDNESIENYLYKMKPDEVSVPLSDGKVWHIFKLIKITDYAQSPQNPLKTFKNRLKERRIKEYGEKYLSALMANVKIPFAEKSFGLLLKEIKKRLTVKMQTTEKDSMIIRLGERDFYDIRDAFASEKVLEEAIMFSDDPVTLRDVLDYFSFHGFSIPKLIFPTLPSKLSSELKVIAQEELLYREGKRQHFDVSPTVEKELSVWKGNALAQVIRNRCLDSLNVSEAEVKDFYMKINSSEEAAEKAQLLIIASKSLDTMTTILDTIKAGKSFESHMQFYAQSEFITSKLMPLPYFTPFYPALLKNKIKDVLGPVKYGDKYYLAKIVKKKKADSLYLKPYEQVKEQLMQIFKSKQMNSYFATRTAALAEKYSVSIDAATVSKMTVNEIPTFVYRFIGFGGVISAAPLTMPMYQWINEYKAKSKQMP